ncbi:hypothetical protein ACVIGA_005567 [Bradyrhizobium sp. USDA 3240]
MRLVLEHQAQIARRHLRVLSQDCFGARAFSIIDCVDYDAVLILRAHPAVSIVSSQSR